MELGHRINKLHYLLIRVVSLSFYTWVFRLKCRLLKISCGDGATIDGKIVLRSYKARAIEFGKNLRVNSRFESNLVGITNKAVFVALEGGRIRIGDDCGLTSPVISSRISVSIGNNALVGANVRIFDHDFHPIGVNDRTRNSAKNIGAKAVQIGDNVFVGTNALILKGVVLGDNVVVGAGAVVSDGVYPSNCVLAGNPAKVVKTLE